MPTLRYMRGPSDELDLRNVVGQPLKVYPQVVLDAGRSRQRNEKAGESFSVTEEQWQAMQNDAQFAGHQFEVVEAGKAEAKKETGK